MQVSFLSADGNGEAPHLFPLIPTVPVRQGPGRSGLVDTASTGVSTRDGVGKFHWREIGAKFGADKTCRVFVTLRVQVTGITTKKAAEQLRRPVLNSP
jgi:hypothetical protein